EGVRADKVRVQYWMKPIAVGVVRDIFGKGLPHVAPWSDPCLAHSGSGAAGYYRERGVPQRLENSSGPGGVTQPTAGVVPTGHPELEDLLGGGRSSFRAI